MFAPLGFGDWRASTALLTGFMAKESVVSTLTVLVGGGVAALQEVFTPFTAFVFLVFTLLYTPCVAAIATVKKETNGRTAAKLVVSRSAPSRGSWRSASAPWGLRSGLCSASFRGAARGTLAVSRRRTKGVLPCV